jgi:transcription initiation factor TFIIB
MYIILKVRFFRNTHKNTFLPIIIKEYNFPSMSAHECCIMQENLTHSYFTSLKSHGRRELTIITQQQSLVCSICKRDDRIVTDPGSGEIICGNSGAVISDKVQDISRPERRTFGVEEENVTRRTGIPTSITFADMGLSTVIGKYDRDATGRPLDAEMRVRMQRLRTWDLRTHSHSAVDRSLMKAFNELSMLKDKLALSNAVVEKAPYIYRKIQERGLIRGRTISGIMAAAIYAACREIGTPYSLRDIAVKGNLKRKDIARNVRKLVFELDLRFPNVDLVRCISRVANKANLTENTKREAIDIMKFQKAYICWKRSYGACGISTLCILLNDWGGQKSN